MAFVVGDTISLRFDCGQPQPEHVQLSIVGVEQPNGSIMCRDESGSLVIIPESWKRYLAQPSPMPTAPGTVIVYRDAAWMLMAWPPRWIAAGHSSRASDEFTDDNYRIIHIPEGGAYL